MGELLRYGCTEEITGLAWLFVIVDQTAEAANEDWVFPGRKRS